MPTTSLTRTVVVFSAMRGRSWMGSIPFTDTRGEPGPDDLDYLFRFFNRVDGCDIDRLNALGYDLPSMTSGDLVTFVNAANERTDWYLCANTGWERLAEPQANAYMRLAEQSARTDKRAPMFTNLEADALLMMADDGWVHINPAGDTITLGWYIDRCFARRF